MAAEPSQNSFRRSLATGFRRTIVVSEKAPCLIRDEDVEDTLRQVAVPRSETRRGDHRDRDRHRLSSESAAICIDGQCHEVELVNLSSGGAMVRGATAAKLWDEVGLRLGDGPAMIGAVRWLKGDLAGIEFVTETSIDCDAPARAALLLDVIRRNFPDSRIALERSEQHPSNREAPADPGHRGELRHPLVWKGEVHFDFSSYPVRLRNISSGGALIDASVQLPVDAELVLDLGNDVQMAARVGWSNGEKTGLAFLSPFDLDGLAAARPEVATHRWERPGFLNAVDQVDEESQWGRSSIARLSSELEGFLKR